MKDKMGVCNICGQYKELTKEHVPPRKAFNNGRWTEILYENDNWLDNPLMTPHKKRIHQGGVYFFSICEKCNNNTGRYYARAYSSWCHYSMDILRRTKGDSSLYIPNSLYPLRVIKQIIVMFFAINGEDFGKRHSDLIPFILNQDQFPIPPQYNVYAYYKLDSNLRYLPESYIGNFSDGPNPIMVTEIGFPPFGFVLSDSTNSQKIDKRLKKITHFSYFPIHEKKDFYDLKLPLLPTVINIPGDYRTETQIQEAMRSSVKKDDKSI